MSFYTDGSLSAAQIAYLARGKSLLTYADGQHLIGIGQQNYRMLGNWNKALIDRAAGIRDARYLEVGDSTTGGFFANGLGFANNRQYAVPNLLAARYRALGIPTNIQNTLGDPTNSGVSLASFLSYDPRWDFDAGWSSSTVNCIGGTIGNNGAGNFTSARCTPGAIHNNTSLYYLQVGGYGSFTFTVDGVNYGGVINCSGANSVVRVNITYPATNKPFSINKVANGNLLFGAFESGLNTEKSVVCLSGAWGGSTILDWADTTNFWYPFTTGSVVQLLQPDLLGINLTINSIISAGDATAFKTALRKILSQRPASCDAILRTNTSLQLFSEAAQLPIQQSCNEVATFDGYPIIPINRNWGSYATATAKGFFAPAGDPTHPGLVGYLDVADAQFESM